MRDLTSEAERAVLACVLMTGGKCLDEMPITGADFADTVLGEVFDAAARVWAAGNPVDSFRLSELLPQHLTTVFALTDSERHVTTASAEYYADVVRKRALRRRLALVGSAFGQFDEDLDFAEVAERARGLIDDAIGVEAGKVQYLADVLPRLIERLNADDVFVPSPWRSLNEIIGGFRPGAVYVVGARPAQGKTVVAGQIAAALAERGHVAFSSLEMSDEELAARFISERLRINVGHIKDSRLDARDWQTLEAGRGALNSIPIAIDDRAGVTASDVRGFVRAVSRKGKLAGAVVDYLQLMSSRDKTDRHVQVADFSRRMKILAKDFRIPVVALSQLNRNSEATTLARPKMSDLRESGAIEQDADVVILLHREGEFPNESLVMNVAKNRHGPTGEFSLSWDGGYSRAVEWDHTDREAP